MHTFDRSRITLGASATGIARAALEYAVEYAKSREQFGKPIAEHQAVAFRLADMATRVDAARLLVHRAARRIDAGEHVPMEAAMAKLRLRDGDVVHLGGGADARRLGLLPEYPVEKWMRDAKLEEIEEGTSDIQRLIISRNLLEVTRDLSALFDPRSVAVVGASSVPGKWGYLLADGALGARAALRVPRQPPRRRDPRPACAHVGRGAAGGTRARRHLRPAAGSRRRWRTRSPRARRRSSPSAPASARWARRARARGGDRRARPAAGAVLVGPNCLGVYDAEAGLELCSEDLVPGSIGLISQSGNLALEVGLLAAEFGLGFSRFVSLGNQADVEAGSSSSPSPRTSRRS